MHSAKPDEVSDEDVTLMFMYREELRNTGPTPTPEIQAWIVYMAYSYSNRAIDDLFEEFKSP